MNTPSEPSSAAADFPALNGWWIGGILTVVVLQFLIGHGNIWRNAFDWDRSILYSYATIPSLVALALFINRRWGLKPFLLHSLQIVCIKFVITASILTVVLMVRSPKPKAEVAVAQPDIYAPDAKRTHPVAPLPAADAELTGVVTAAKGRPVAHALVFVRSGIGEARGGEERPPYRMTIDAAGFHAVDPQAQLVVGQPLELSSTDKRLHTIRAARMDGRWLFNLPLLASGQPRSVEIHEDVGTLDLRCTVHGAAEPEGKLRVLPNPFFTQSDEKGAFTLKLPSGSLTIAVIDPDGHGMSRDVQLAAGAKEKMTLEMAGK